MLESPDLHDPELPVVVLEFISPPADKVLDVVVVGAGPPVSRPR